MGGGRFVEWERRPVKFVGRKFGWETTRLEATRFLEAGANTIHHMRRRFTSKREPQLPNYLQRN